MKTFTIFAAAAVFLMLTTTAALAGHHYHGHGCMGGSWNMEEMDTNKDGNLSFEEFSDGQTQKLKSGFEMIDKDQNGVISSEEWDAFLEVHGMKKS